MKTLFDEINLNCLTDAAKLFGQVTYNLKFKHLENFSLLVYGCVSQTQWSILPRKIRLGWKWMLRERHHRDWKRLSYIWKKI